RQMSEGEDMTEARLLAYVDGRLTADERAEIDRYLAANSDRAEEVARWQRQNEAIAALYPAVDKDALPDRLGPQRIARGIAVNSNARLAQVAAALVLVVLGGVIGWAGRDAVLPVETAGNRLIDSAV